MLPKPTTVLSTKEKILLFAASLLVANILEHVLIPTLWPKNWILDLLLSILIFVCVDFLYMVATRKKWSENSKFYF